MRDISFEADISTMESELPKWAADRVPSITRNALNDTADDARFAEQQKMRGVFDRVTPYIERSPRYQRATKADLVATVYIEDDGAQPPAKILHAEVKGGPRRAKGFEIALRRIGVMRADEFAIPAIGQRRDAFGNLPGSIIVQMLSQLRGFTEVGFNANVTARSRKRNKSRARHFFVPSGARFERGIGKLPRGVYVRERGSIRAVVLFVSGPPRYGEHYDFGQATIAKAQRVFGPYWQRHFYAELAKHTAKG